MMPVKEILDMEHLEPRPPVLVIDETTIKSTTDAGPICGCDEKYELIKNYKPFLPGGVHPYARRKIQDSECFEIYWKPLKIGEKDLLFDTPVAVHQAELPENTTLPKKPRKGDLMFLRQPKYTKGYLMEKLNECPREHSEDCSCPGK